MATNKTIIEDVDKTTAWLVKRNIDIAAGKTLVDEKDMPVLARIICGGEEEISKLTAEKRKIYEKVFSENKKQIESFTLAKTCVAGVSIGAIASGIGAVGTLTMLGTGAASTLAMLGTGMGFALPLAGFAIPGIGPIIGTLGVGMLAAGSTSYFKNKDKKEQKEKLQKEQKEKLQKIIEKSLAGAQQCGEKIVVNNQTIKNILSEQLKRTSEYLAQTSKKVLINIDDALNSDVNLRIMQYQEIVVQQYNSQNEIRKMFNELSEAYNKLVAENEKLSEQIAAYEATMKICGCAHSYIA